MNFLKNFNPHHYEYYLNISETIRKESSDIDEWVRNLGIEDLTIILRTIKQTKLDNIIYFEESAIMMTLIIKLFICELNIETNQVLLNNIELKKIFDRFEKSVKKEYGIRKDIKIRNKKPYSLLKN